MEASTRPLRWLRLDNAALIFPAALRRHWSNAFRISFSFTESVDPALLQQALDRIAPRFPSMVVRLRRSAFWYYLEELPQAPAVQADVNRPLRTMSMREVQRCAIRVLYYRDRIAVEFFHAVTDGTGGMVFAKSLAAEYLRLRHGLDIPCVKGVLNPDEAPRDGELADAFQEHAGPLSAPRDDRKVFRLRGTTEPDRFLHQTCGVLDSAALHQGAKEKGVSVTAYLCALLLQSILEIQAAEQPRRAQRKNVRIQIPVNLRQLYGGESLRNFVAVANIGVDPRLGDYSFDELLHLVHHQMKLAITPKNMAAIFAPNVRDERNVLLKAVPLFIKNPIMRLVFDRIGESVSCLSFSNLGQLELPEEMQPLVRRAEFILGAQASAPYNVSCLSCGGKTYLNVVRNCREPKLESRLFPTLVRQGFAVRVESNDR